MAVIFDGDSGHVDVESEGDEVRICFKTEKGEMFVEVILNCNQAKDFLINFSLAFGVAMEHRKGKMQSWSQMDRVE